MLLIHLQKIMAHKGFLKDVMYIINDFLTLMVESIWFQRLAYKLCPKVVFPSKFVEKVMLLPMQKTLLKHVQHVLTTCVLVTCTFDILMLKETHNVFVVIINSILEN